MNQRTPGQPSKEYFAYVTAWLVQLCRQKGMTYTDACEHISSAMKISPRTVKRHYSRFRWVSKFFCDDKIQKDAFTTFLNALYLAVEQELKSGIWGVARNVLEVPNEDAVRHDLARYSRRAARIASGLSAAIEGSDKVKK